MSDLWNWSVVPKPWEWGTRTTNKKGTKHMITLPNTPENRYVKEVFDHLIANFKDKQFGYNDLPGTDRNAKSGALVILKQLGLRESVAYKTFELTSSGKNSTIELS